MKSFYHHGFWNQDSTFASRDLLFVLIAIIISKFFVVMCLNEKVDKFVVRFNQEVFSIDLAKITN